MVWQTSAQELLELARRGFLAMIPIVEQAHIPWHEPENYDDWDGICSAIYQSVVINTFQHGRETTGAVPLPGYDVRLASYEGQSFITVSESAGSLAFVCFETVTKPFDTCLFARLMSNGDVAGYERRLAAAINVVFVMNTGGQTRCLNSITLDI